MQNLPLYIPLVFVLTTLYVIFIFWKASQYNWVVSIVLIGWLSLQAVISLCLYYTNFDAMPPRFLLMVLPAFATIAVLLATRKGREFISRLKIDSLILLNAVRLPVEIVLYWLFTKNAVPQEMTFTGGNLDILSGISAPIVWLMYRKTQSRALLVIWNVVCIILLVNIVSTAIMAAPTPFQQMGFNQPNIAVMYFPYAWLPSCIVPLVLLSHLTMLSTAVFTKNVQLTGKKIPMNPAGADQ